MSENTIIVIGASAGGVEALRALAEGLDADLPASLFVVLHVPPNTTSHLPEILDRAERLVARHAVDGEAILPGRIYVAPPDRHLLVERDRVRVVEGPTENRHRPAIDPLFRSAARAYGSRVVGVVLTGALDDGTAGLLAIKRRGGIAVVQDPSDALYPSMPRSALEYVEVDHVAPLAEIPALLASLVANPAPDPPPAPADDVQLSELYAEEVFVPPSDDYERAAPSAITCPDCHGTLWENGDEGLLQFRCRVGHAWSSESMIAAQDASTERALWAALRSLEENAVLAKRLAEKARERQSTRTARRFEQRMNEAAANAAVLRRLLGTVLATNDPETDATMEVERE